MREATRFLVKWDRLRCMFFPSEPEKLLIMNCSLGFVPRRTRVEPGHVSEGNGGEQDQARSSYRFTFLSRFGSCPVVPQFEIGKCSYESEGHILPWSKAHKISVVQSGARRPAS